MTGPFGILAEARIRDWHRRREAGEISPAAPETEGDSIESQLLHRIVALTERARQVAEIERGQLEREARLLEIQLMVSLEGAGLPLAAQRIACELERIRGGGARR